MNDVMDVSARSIQAPLSPPMLYGEQTQNGALTEDIMDMSTSDIDEGEITDFSPEPPNTIKDEAQIPEGDDTYEPPLNFAPVPLTAATSQPNGPDKRASVSNSPPVKPTGKQECAEESHDSHLSSKSSEDTNESGEISAISRTQSAADDSDPDDYEPPEPATPVEPSTIPLNHDIDTSKPPFAPQTSDVSSAGQAFLTYAAPGSQEQVDVTRTSPGNIDTPKVRSYNSSQS